MENGTFCVYYKIKFSDYHSNIYVRPLNEYLEKNIGLFGRIQAFYKGGYDYIYPEDNHEEEKYTDDMLYDWNDKFGKEIQKYIGPLCVVNNFIFLNKDKIINSGNKYEETPRDYIFVCYILKKYICKNCEMISLDIVYDYKKIITAYDFLKSLPYYSYILSYIVEDGNIFSKFIDMIPNYELNFSIYIKNK